MSKFPAVDAVLSNEEKTQIKRFIENETMMNAVKKVLLFPIYYNGALEAGKDPDPTRNSLLTLMGTSRNLPNEHLGGVLRAQMEGITYLENGFKTLEDYSKDEPVGIKIDINEAR